MKPTLARVLSAKSVSLGESSTNASQPPGYFLSIADRLITTEIASMRIATCVSFYSLVSNDPDELPEYLHRKLRLLRSARLAG